MADKEIITNIKDLKEYLKYLLNNEIRHREKERGIGVYLAENIQRYDFQCAEILLLQRLLKKLGVKIEDYDPFETDEDDNKYVKLLNECFDAIKPEDLDGSYLVNNIMNL